MATLISELVNETLKDLGRLRYEEITWSLGGRQQPRRQTMQDSSGVLRKFKFLNYDEEYQYAPPQEDCVVNVSAIQTVTVCSARGSGPFCKVKFLDGSEIICVGIPSDFL